MLAPGKFRVGSAGWAASRSKKQLWELCSQSRGEERRGALNAKPLFGAVTRSAVSGRHWGLWYKRLWMFWTTGWDVSRFREVAGETSVRRVEIRGLNRILWMTAACGRSEAICEGSWVLTLLRSWTCSDPKTRTDPELFLGSIVVSTPEHTTKVVGSAFVLCQSHEDVIGDRPALTSVFHPWSGLPRTWCRNS